MSAGLPSVKDDSDVMIFSFLVLDEQVDQSIPMPAQIMVMYTDQVVAVDNKRGNFLTPCLIRIHTLYTDMRHSGLGIPSV